MTAPLAPYLGHIASSDGWSSSATLVIATAAVFSAALVVQHLRVKHGHLGWRQARQPLAIVVALGMAAVVAPSPSGAQSTIGAMGLPDLVSDPAFIWVEQVRTHPVDGRIMRTLAFDGILHNIGTGALEVAGNPQVDGGVKQRVFDGEQWTDVGEPLVQYETDDGHNHFHLMNAAAYSLWNEGQTEQVETGDKVGFCLLDTQQIERGVEAAYLIDDINYCNVDEPDSTDLRMGISPGWVDIYEASITFQWVDTSDTVPGRYWVGSTVDPNDEIVESNEDNNDIVFSRNKYAVSGYNARPLAAQDVGEIQLKASTYGTVGQLAYVIVEPPKHGRLSVPTGYDLLLDTIEYVPDAGYEGTDSFSYYAHDVSTPFPFNPLVVDVDIAVNNAASIVGDDDVDPAQVTIQAPTSEIETTRYERQSIMMEIDGIAADQVRWFAKDLPPGLAIDADTGEISGELTMPGEANATIVARLSQFGGMDLEATIKWVVADASQPSLRAIDDFSTARERRDIVIGSGTAETTYRATGLPEGLVLTEGQPSILGTPTEIGEFAIVVEELLDGDVVDRVDFAMSVRPAATPEFAL